MKNRKKLYLILLFIGFVIMSLSTSYYYFYVKPKIDNEKIKDMYSPKEPPSNLQKAELLDENNF